MIIPSDSKLAAAFECRAVPSVNDDALGLTFAACVGSRCAHFRLLPHKTDPAWVTAVQRATIDIGDTSPNRAKAAAHVGANRKTYGLPEHPTTGYCGLAGKPEVS